MNTVTKSENKFATSAGTGDGNGAGAKRISYVVPATNIAETPEGYLLEAEMPGVLKDGLEVSVGDGELTIIGRRSSEERRGVALHRESRLADYRRIFELDPSIDTSKISAKLDNGVLFLHLPKTEAVKPRKIEVS